MFYSVNDIAEMTRLSTRTIRRFIKDGNLKGRKIGGQWRFTDEDYIKFLDTSDVSNQINLMNKEIIQKYINNDISNMDLKNSKSLVINFCSFNDQSELDVFKNKMIKIFNVEYEKKGNSLNLTQLENYILKIVYEGDLDFFNKIDN